MSPFINVILHFAYYKELFEFYVIWKLLFTYYYYITKLRDIFYIKCLLETEF